MFPNSELAKKYGAEKTKTSQIIKGKRRSNLKKSKLYRLSSPKKGDIKFVKLILLWFNPDQSPLGPFRGGATQITACAPPARNVPPKQEMCPQARIVPQTKVTGPVPLECISGLVPPQNTARAPPSVSKVSFQDEKYEWRPRRSLRFNAEDPFFVFTPEFVDRDPHHKPPRPVML